MLLWSFNHCVNGKDIGRVNDFRTSEVKGSLEVNQLSFEDDTSFAVRMLWIELGIKI